MGSWAAKDILFGLVQTGAQRFRRLGTLLLLRRCQPVQTTPMFCGKRFRLQTVGIRVGLCTYCEPWHADKFAKRIGTVLPGFARYFPSGFSIDNTTPDNACKPLTVLIVALPFCRLYCCLPCIIGPPNKAGRQRH